MKSTSAIRSDNSRARFTTRKALKSSDQLQSLVTIPGRGGRSSQPTRPGQLVNNNFPLDNVEQIEPDAISWAKKHYVLSVWGINTTTAFHQITMELDTAAPCIVETMLCTFPCTFMIAVVSRAFHTPRVHTFAVAHGQQSHYS